MDQYRRRRTAFYGCFDAIETFELTSIADKEIKAEQDKRAEAISLAEELEEKSNITAMDGCQSSMSKLAWFVLDCLSINHNNGELDERFFWTLGDGSYLSKKGMYQLKSDYLCNIPSNIVCGMDDGDAESKDERQSEDDASNAEQKASPSPSGSPVASEASASVQGSDPDDNDPSENEPNFTEAMKTFLNKIIKTTGIGNNNKNDNNNKIIATKADLLANGFLLRRKYLRGIIDGLKCRIGLKNLEKLINIDFSNNIHKFEINCSDLIVLLLEISNETIHQQIVSGAIELQIPIPILYPMCNINVNLGDFEQKLIPNENPLTSTGAATMITTPANNTADKPDLDISTPNETSTNTYDVNVDYYIRDTLHLASCSKLMNDSKSQTNISRNKPLIMFVGSDEVIGKSTMLQHLFEGQKFNAFSGENEIDSGSEATVLHNNSVDLVYLKDSHNCNYHILDVHGSINDPFFEHCSRAQSGNKSEGESMSRMSALLALASLCDCVVIQIHKSQLTSNVEPKKRTGEVFSVKSLISQNTGKRILKFVSNLKVSHVHTSFCVKNV